MRVLDLCAGELGWSKIFAARGHQCVCVDLKEPKEIPSGCEWYRADVLEMGVVRHSFKRRDACLECAQKIETYLVGLPLGIQP